MSSTGRALPGLMFVLLLSGCTVTTPGEGTVGTPVITSSVGDAAGNEATASFPDVVSATLEPDRGTWLVSATISSPYDTPQRYADAFRVLTEEGDELGVRELLHDHADEQPFTRTLAGVRIPGGVDRVVVQGRDLIGGWGGGTVTVPVPPAP